MTTGHLSHKFKCMADNLIEFFRTHPFWAGFIILFAILPIAGLVAQIILRAMGKRGIDNTSDIPDDNKQDESDDNPTQEMK